MDEGKNWLRLRNINLKLDNTHYHPYIALFINMANYMTYIYIYIYGGNDTRSIFKRSLTGLNSEFSFS